MSELILEIVLENTCLDMETLYELSQTSTYLEKSVRDYYKRNYNHYATSLEFITEGPLLPRTPSKTDNTLTLYIVRNIADFLFYHFKLTGKFEEIQIQAKSLISNVNIYSSTNLYDYYDFQNYSLNHVGILFLKHLMDEDLYLVSCFFFSKVLSVSFLERIIDSITGVGYREEITKERVEISWGLLNDIFEGKLYLNQKQTILRELRNEFK